MSFKRTITSLALLACVMFISVFFSTCADKIKTDIIVFRTLDEGLVKSNEVIQLANQSICRSLEDKLSEPITVERAKVWHPKALLIKTLSENMFDRIEKLKLDLKKEAGLKTVENDESFNESNKNAVIRFFKKQGIADKLLEELKKYKKDLLDIDSAMAGVFRENMILTTKIFDFVKDDQRDFTQTFFDDIPTIAALATLSKFQNNVRIIQNRMTTFCNNKVGAVDGVGFYTTYHLFAAVSSSYVKRNEEIEVTAGMVEINKYAHSITINGKVVDLGDIGLATYKFRAPNKPGKQYIPVKITYLDQEGKPQTASKNIEYTVAQ